MATEKRKKLPQFTTPKGTFRFPKLTEPDKGNEKFPKPDGEYSVQLLLTKDSPEFVKMMGFLQQPYDEAMAEAEQLFKELPVGTRKKLGKVTPNALYTIIYDKETEEETGEVAFKFAMKASGTTKAGKKWARRPDIFDARGKLMTKLPDIWGGTVGKVSFEAGSYFIPGTGAAGLKLHLRGAQVIDLVSSGGRSAESHGFEEEDGYEYEEPAAAAAVADEGDDADATANF